MKKETTQVVKAGDSKVTEKYKFIDEGLGTYHSTLREYKRFIKLGNEKGLSFDNAPNNFDDKICKEIYLEMSDKKPEVYDVVDSRWNCIWQKMGDE